MCSFIGIEEFTEHCRRVYFATDDYSQASYIIVVSGLYYIFEERAFAATDGRGSVQDSLRYYQMCRDNLETALGHFGLLQPAKRENIEALLLGTTYAISSAKPSLAWQLSSAACQLCLTMGYHRAEGTASRSASMDHGAIGALGGGRESSSGVDDAITSSKRQTLFIFTYTLDKGLALRLGRASVLQDAEITVPRRLGPLSDYEVYRDTLNSWVYHAELQGRIYSELYSPAALQRPVEQRVQKARELAALLKEIIAELPGMRMYQLPPASQEHRYDLGVMDMLMKSDQVSILSSLALCYRAIPPDGRVIEGDGASKTFNQECIDVAREAMQTHQGCMELISQSRELATAYIHWTILYSPFIPFIVVFCHVIETSNTDDISRLADFVRSLEVCSSLSEPVGKLHRLCNALANVASTYVETKKQHMAATPSSQPDGMYPVNMEFDMYLRDLGFMPPHADNQPLQPGPSLAQQQEQHTQQPQQPGFGGEYGNAHLGEWFSGNLSMMGMLERDLSQFSSGVWAQNVVAPVVGPGQEPEQDQI